jgi:uncharacterized membrane protein YeaQ/YmgE (transglycosylase-associated protein family)
MNIVSLLIQCLSGAVGGNIAGVINKTKSLGPMWNTSFGLLGGVLGGQLLGSSVADMTGNATAGNVIASALVGFILPYIGGILRKAPA